MVTGIYLVLALLAGYAVYRSLDLDVPLDSLLEVRAKPPSQFLEVEGQSVHYRDQGARDAPVILLLHGTSASLHTFEGWAEKLQENWRVISVDLPGFGLTGPWIGALESQDYSRENYAIFLFQFMDKLKIKRFAVAGNSLGGEVAWQMAASSKERVSAQILLNAAGYADTGGQYPLAWKLITWPITSSISMSMLPRSAVAQGLRQVMVDQNLVTPDKIELYRDLGLRAGNRKALQQRLRFITADGGVQHLPQIEIPTLIIWGEQDVLIPSSTAKRFLKDIRGSELVIFDDLGHIPQEENPERTVAVAIDFLRKTNSA
ncbi:MAG: alpha/beta hydrolase [Rhizobiaceae bacterium]